MIHSICQIISQTKLISQLACTIWRCVYRLRSYEGRVQRTPHADWLQTVTSSDDVTGCRRSRACCDWNGRVCSLHFCALFFLFPLVIAIVVVAVAITSSRVVGMCLCVRLCHHCQCQLSTVYRL